MKYKWSCFVSFHTMPTGKFWGYMLLFNSVNRAKLLIPTEAKVAIDRFIENGELQDEELKEIVTQLVSCDMLVEEDQNEKIKYEQIRAKSADFLGKAVFYFAPSYSCNFKCVYCIVNAPEHGSCKQVEFMDDDLIRQSAKWMVEYTAELGAKEIEVIFFGGEPSLGFKQNLLLIESVYQYKPEDVQVSCTMISNGYIFDEEAILKLKNYGFKGVQITVDGPPRIHDKRRMTVDDQGTFAIILENIKKYLNAKLQVNVRVNVDKENGPFLTELVDIFKEHGLEQDNRFELSFTPVDPSDDKDIKGYDPEALKWYSSFYRYAKQKGFKNMAMWSTFCGVTSKHIITIGFHGELYHCANYLGEESQVVGSIVTNEFNELYYKYIDLDIPEKCKTCKWTGICGGGCVLVRNNLKGKYCLKDTYDHIVPAYLFAKYDAFDEDDVDL